MLKMIGIICILAGCTGLGLTLSEELKFRVRELQELQELMIRLRAEIRYTHEPLPEAFLHLGSAAARPFSDFFLQTAKDLQACSGKTAQEIWEKNLSNTLKGLHLSGQEKKELEKLGSMLGCLDVEMQMNVLDYYLEQLKASSLRAAQTAGNRRRLYQYLGILSGVMLAILLV